MSTSPEEAAGESKMGSNDPQQVDIDLRKHLKSLCAPIWWESAKQTIVNSGTMCVVRTPEALLGVTNDHVLRIYEKHKADKEDIFCQLGSAPFDPTENLISRSQYWDLATFKIPHLTLTHWGHEVFEARVWPPTPIEKDDHVVFGGYPEISRSVPSGPNPPTMSIGFMSFRRQPHNCSAEHISFQIDPATLTWLPGETLEPG